MTKGKVVREVDMQEFFDYNQIAPLTIIYEESINQPEQSVKNVFDYLGLKAPDLSGMKDTYQRTSDAISEEWVSKFRKKLQKKWDRVIW